MITLSATLLTAQKSGRGNRLWKVVLSRTGQTTRGYRRERLKSINYTEEPSSQKVEIVLNNADKTLTSLDFEHYQVVFSAGFRTGVTRSAWVANTAYAIDAVVRPTTANGYQYQCAVAGTSHATTEPTWPTSIGITVTDGTVTWEMDGDAGDEYIRRAPMRVRVQENHSGRSISKCILRAIGIIDQMAEDKAKSEYRQESTDTNTVKTLITAIAGATLTPYTSYTAYTVVYDSEDSIIDTFIPKDYFSVSTNETRWDKIEELLAYTGCKARIGNDGKLHIFDPVTSGTTYNYEYKFNVTGEHNFYNKSIRLRFIKPNEEIVKSASEHETQYSGSATSATSYALAPKANTTYRRLPSNALATSIAAAKIEQNELDDERGFLVTPMNVGQELWDYVKVTDSRQGDTRIGNIQYLRFNFELPEPGGRMTPPLTLLSFGKVSILSIMSNLATAGFGMKEEIARLSDEQIMALFDAVDLALDELANRYNDLARWAEDRYWFLINRETVFKWHVIQQLIIPVVT